MILVYQTSATSPVQIVGLAPDARQTAETDPAFATRMAVTYVPAGARWHSFDPAALPNALPERWIVDYDAGTITVASTSQADLYSYAANARYVKMTGGTLWNGVRISTTDDAAGRIKNKRDLIRDGQAAEPFKMVIGPTTINATLAMMNALVKTVGDHWQSCFDTQSTVNAGIAGGTITTLAQIDAAFV